MVSGVDEEPEWEAEPALPVDRPHKNPIFTGGLWMGGQAGHRSQGRATSDRAGCHVVRQGRLLMIVISRQTPTLSRTTPHHTAPHRTQPGCIGNILHPSLPVSRLFRVYHCLCEPANLRICNLRPATCDLRPAKVALGDHIHTEGASPCADAAPRLVPEFPICVIAEVVACRCTCKPTSTGGTDGAGAALRHSTRLKTPSQRTHEQR